MTLADGVILPYNDSFVLIGGQSVNPFNHYAFDSVIQFTKEDDYYGHFKRTMEEKLSTERAGHVAVVLDQNQFVCTSSAIEVRLSIMTLYMVALVYIF